MALEPRVRRGPVTSADATRLSKCGQIGGFWNGPTFPDQEYISAASSLRCTFVHLQFSNTIQGLESYSLNQ